MFAESKQEPKIELENGNELLDALTQIRATTKRTTKEAGIRELARHEASKEFFEGMKYAYQGSITFGVKMVPSKAKEAVTKEPALTWLNFKDLLENLNKRQTTGLAARNAIVYAMEHTDEQTWNSWYRLILMKDLKIGCSETTTNKILNELGRESECTEVYACALAEHIDTLWDESENIRMPMSRIPTDVVYADVKLNGIRMNAFVDPIEKTVVLKSREGRVLENFPSINQSLEKLFDFYSIPMMLDGEVMSRNFQALMTQVTRKEDVRTEDCIFHVFDIITKADFDNGISEKPYQARITDRTALQSVLDRHGVSNVRNLKSHLFNLASSEGCARLEDFRREALQQGFEGLVIKLPNSKYQCKRTFDWLAYKPTITVDLAVIGFVEGEAGTKNEGSLGALIMEGEYKGKKIRVHVGSGFKPDQETRKTLWDFKDTEYTCLGNIAEIRADEVTKAQDGEFWSLRFPRFVQWRGFKAGEKI